MPALHTGPVTHILKASTSADFLAMVPALVGFAPRDSVVIVIFRGKRTAGAMRIDLPRSPARAVHKRVVNTCLGMLSRLVGIDSIVPVIYTDRGFGGDVVIPESDFAEVLLRRLKHCGFDLREALCVAPDGWASYLEGDVVAGGHPLDEIAESTVADTVPADWRRLPDIQDLPSRVPDAPPAARARMAADLALYMGLRDRVSELDEGVDSDADHLEGEFAPIHPLVDIPLFAEDALAWDTATLESDGAMLLFMIQGPPARDLVMLQWATSLEVGDAIFDDPHAVWVAGVDIGDLMLGKAPRPDVERLERGIEILQDLVSRAEDHARRAPLCMLVWSFWALGRASHAAAYLAEVRAIDPGYSMGELLDTVLTNIPVPEWAFADPARP